MAGEWQPGQLVKAARLRKGLSARSAARAAGVDEKVWRMMESGVSRPAAGVRVEYHPTERTVHLVATAVGLEPDELLAAVAEAEVDRLRGTRRRLEIQQRELLALLATDLGENDRAGYEMILEDIEAAIRQVNKEGSALLAQALERDQDDALVAAVRETNDDLTDEERKQILEIASRARQRRGTTPA